MQRLYRQTEYAASVWGLGSGNVGLSFAGYSIADRGCYHHLAIKGNLLTVGRRIDSYRTLKRQSYVEVEASVPVGIRRYIDFNISRGVSSGKSIFCIC